MSLQLNVLAALGIHLHVSWGSLEHFANKLSFYQSRERMHLFKPYSQFSFDSSNGGATAVEFSHRKTDEKPCEYVVLFVTETYLPYLFLRNLTSRSAFFTKPRWYPGAYSQISGAIERASSRAVILNKGFAPNPVISAVRILYFILHYDSHLLLERSYKGWARPSAKDWERHCWAIWDTIRLLHRLCTSFPGSKG